MTGRRGGDDAEPLLVGAASASPSLTSVPMPDADSDSDSDRGGVHSSALPAASSHLRTLLAGGGGSAGSQAAAPYPSPFALLDRLPLWRRYPLPSACGALFVGFLIMWLFAALFFGGSSDSDTAGLGKLGGLKSLPSDATTLALIASLLKARNESQPPVPIPQLFDRVEGYFTLFRGTGLAQGRVLLEVPASELDKPFIVTAMYTAGDAEVALTHMPAETVDHNVFAFRKSDAVFAALDLYRPNLDLRVADNTSAMARSYEEGTWPGWLKTFGVLHNTTSDGYLLDATSWIEGGMFVLESDSGAVDSKKVISYGARFLNATAYPRNVELDVQMRARSVAVLGESDLSPENIFSFIVHYSLAALPEKPMPVRTADERLGYFGQSYIAVDADRALHDKRTLVHRWDLSKRRPVVYHVDPTVPTTWWPVMKDGVEEWNKAFAAVGKPDAVRVVLPSDDDWPDDYAAGDVRYNSISWAPSLGDTYALGPSDVDPRTGEILNADIVFTHGWVRAWLRDYREFVGEVNTLSRFHVPDAPGDVAATKSGRMRAVSHLNTRPVVDGEQVDGLGVQMLLANHRLQEWEEAETLARAAALNASASSATASPLADVLQRDSTGAVSGVEAYLMQALKSVVMHETGHTLGLRHNFRASANVPWDKLSDAKYVAEHGITSSVMDYLPVLVRANPADHTAYFTPVIGAYDYAAIKFGYGDFKTDAELSSFAETAATEYGLTFATDSDGVHPNGPDPLASLWDVSATPLDYHENVLQLSRKVATRLMNATSADVDASWLDFTRSMETALKVAARSLQYATKFVGGQLPSRAHSTGRAGNAGSVPLRPVDGATQAKALALILRELDPRSGVLGASTVATYGLYMVHRVGDSCEKASTQCLGFAASDVPQLLRELRGHVLSSLLHPDRLNRLTASRAMASGVPSVSSLLRQVTDTLFMTHKDATPSSRRALDPLPFPAASVDRVADAAVVDDVVQDAQAQWLRMLLEQVAAPVYQATENHPLAMIALAGEVARIHEGARLAAKDRPEDAHLRGVLWVTRKFASNLNDIASGD
ncbi:hypothetical protein MMPV_004772 [Pyropia vietnamensis]